MCLFVYIRKEILKSNKVCSIKDTKIIYYFLLISYRGILVCIILKLIDHEKLWLS